MSVRTRIGQLFGIRLPILAAIVDAEAEMALGRLRRLSAG